MRSLALAGAAAAALSMTACRIDPGADVAAYRSVLDRGLVRRDVPAPGAPIDVVTSMRLANARNESLDVQGEAYVRALVDRRRAVAAFLPTVELVPTGFWRDRTDPKATSRGFDLPLETSIDVDLVADAAALRRTDASADVARERLLALQDDVLLDAARAHFAVLLAERRLGVLRSSIAVQSARVEDARGRVEAEVGRPVDVALAESRVADARVQATDAETDARVGRSVLAFVTGFDVGASPLDDALAVAEPPSTPERLVREAWLRRPEVDAADAAVDEARAGVEVAYGGYWPSVAIDFTHFLTRDSDPTEQEWTSLFRLNVPLFRAGLVEADVRDALSRLREAVHLRERARRSVRRDVETAHATLAADRRRIEELRALVGTARLALEQAEGLWAEGLGSNLERLVAQDTVLAAELDLAEAELDRKEHALVLLRATGTLHEAIGLSREPAQDVASQTPHAETDGAEAR